MTTADNADLGLRERKKRETRDALSQAAIRLCVQRGWDNVTVADIAAAAGVSPRTFRNYFSGKAEAIADRHLARTRRIADELRARPDTEPFWDALTEAVLSQFAPGEPAGPPDQRWRDAVQLMLAEPALQGEVSKVSAAARTALTEAVAQRTGTDPAHELYPTLVATLVDAAVGATVEHCLRADPAVPLAPLLRSVLGRLATGLPAPTDRPKTGP